MFSRKLNSLGYEKPEDFNVNNQREFRQLVVWLEDFVIRHYAIEQRAGLKDIQNPQWERTFQAYLNDISCPADRTDLKCVCDWLLGFAVSLNYSDNVDSYSNVTAKSVEEKRSSAPRIVHDNPLDKMDFNSPDFHAGVKSLATLLKVTPHSDPAITLEAIATLTCNIASKAKEKKSPADKRQEKVQSLPLSECPLGFKSGGPAVDQAAKAMRLLYIHDLRDLQTQINETIVAVQNVTANPKTDTRLGKVGH